MKTNNSKIAIFIAAMFFIAFTGFAQEEDDSYVMAELMYMLPKMGQEADFVKGVKAHNEAYHNAAPHTAHLDRIETGKEAGWHVWIMAPCTFSDLDGRPNDDAHTQDWNDRVGKHVARYGRTEYWMRNDKLSLKSDESVPGKEEIWFIDVEDNKGSVINGFLEKVKAAFEKKGNANYHIYNNRFNAGDGREMAIVWEHANWASFDNNNGGIKKEFEEINGEGSWEKALEDWRSAVKRMNQQVWSIGIDK